MHFIGRVTMLFANNSLMECLITMKLRQGVKKICKYFMVIRHSIKELLAKSMVTRPMKCTVGDTES